MREPKRSHSPLPGLAALAALIAAAGCVRFTPGMTSHGYVADSYVSVITPPPAAAACPAAAIRVAPLAHAAPTWDMGGIGGLPRLFPVASFFASPVVIINQVDDDTATRLPLQPGECERLLAAELTKAGLARATPAAGPDFEIRGRMDFAMERHVHFSGFGAILYNFTILPPLLTPMTTTHLVATAHLELVSLRTHTCLLSRDYTQRCHYLTGLPVGNVHRHFTGFGAEVLPPLVRQFTQDLQALPPGTWDTARL